MSNLQQLQNNFAQHLFDKKQQKIISATNYSKTEALARLNIYRNNVFGNFLAVLSSTYPITKKIIGEKKFEKVAIKFCHAFPSKSGDLNNFGQQFPEFTKSLKPLYLQDLAQLELFFHQSYFASQDNEKIEITELQKIDLANFEKIIFSLSKTAVLFNSEFPIYSIWHEEKKIKKTQPQQVIIHRNQIFNLSEEQFRFAKLVSQKLRLYKIYQNLCDFRDNQNSKKKDKNHEIDFGALLNFFISNGLITKFDL